MRWIGNVFGILEYDEVSVDVIGMVINLLFDTMSH